MELLSANHSSYPRIGDDHEDQLLRRTLTLWEKGEKQQTELRAAEDRMTEKAIAEQVEAGLDLVTDGQIRWPDPVSHLAGKLSGVRIDGLLRFFDTNCYFRQPVVSRKPLRAGALITDEFRFAIAYSPRPVKAVLTGPYTLARLSALESGEAGAFATVLEGYTETLAQEVKALVAAGAQVIQVEEPGLLRHPEDFAASATSLAELAKDKGQARLGVSVYFGNAAPLFAKLITLPVDILGLDFTYSPGLLDVVANTPSGQILSLGLLDGRNTRLEDAAVVARQLETFARRAQPGTVYLTTSCGLEYLPRDRARLKLRHLATIRKTFLGGGA